MLPRRSLLKNDARRATARRAFSLIEILAVLVIVGLLSSMAFMRFGTTHQTTSAEGFVRTLMLDLRQARARTISTGDNHYVLLSRSSGVVVSYTLYRETGSGDAVVDRTVTVPDGTTVTTGTDQWEFEFDGSLGAGTGTSTIVVSGPHYQWTITVYLATGTTDASRVAL